jgi:hypothetical protein
MSPKTENATILGREPHRTMAFCAGNAALLSPEFSARLEQTLMPLLDRAQRMMIRALDRLEARRCGMTNTMVSIGTAGQVNVGGNVRNVLD